MEGVILFLSSSCSKEDTLNENVSDPPMHYGVSYGAFDPSEPSEILDHIENFIGGVVNDDLSDLPVDQGIWKLEAALNFVFRNTSAPLGASTIDSIFFDVDLSSGQIDADDLKMMFNTTIDHCENAASEQNMEVAFIDITPLEGGGLRATPVYAVFLPPPPSIPSMGDWKANQHGACGTPHGNCQDEATSGNKISELVVHRYYYDIYHNQGLDGSYAHFHTGIFTAGTGNTSHFYCPPHPGWSALDLMIQESDVFSNWNLFGTAYWPNPIVVATSADQCITEQSIVDYADYIENKAIDYNPGNSKKLFNFRMGHDFIGQGMGYHVPGIINYGNFVYTPQYVQIYGY